MKLLTDSVRLNYLKNKYNLDKLMRVLYLINLTMCLEEIPKGTTRFDSSYNHIRQSQTNHWNMLRYPRLQYLIIIHISSLNYLIMKQIPTQFRWHFFLGMLGVCKTKE